MTTFKNKPKIARLSEGTIYPKSIQSWMQSRQNMQGVNTNRLPLIDGTNFIFPVRKLYRLWSVTWM